MLGSQVAGSGPHAAALDHVQPAEIEAVAGGARGGGDDAAAEPVFATITLDRDAAVQGVSVQRGDEAAPPAVAGHRGRGVHAGVELVGDDVAPVAVVQVQQLDALRVARDGEAGVGIAGVGVSVDEADHVGTTVPPGAADLRAARDLRQPERQARSPRSWQQHGRGGRIAVEVGEVGAVAGEGLVVRRER